jgi:hypothetical protein
MAGLPHFKNSKAGLDKYEPIYLNQFEVNIFPPPLVAGRIGWDFALQHVKSISSLPELAGNSDGALVTQRYKFAERMYAAPKPKTTSFAFTIDFELNLNDNNENYIYNAFRAWANLIYDPMTGAQGLKKDYADATVEIIQFNRAGSIFRQFRFSPVFLGQAKFNEQKPDYAKDDIALLTVPFIADQYVETRIGQ